MTLTIRDGLELSLALCWDKLHEMAQRCAELERVNTELAAKVASLEEPQQA
jgi:hypothetical protein